MPKPHINRKHLARDYGFALAFMNSDPELKHLFNQAVKHTWTAEKFTAKLRDSKWFRHHSVSVRNSIMQETADPATYKQRVKQMEATVRDAWGANFGATLDQGDARSWAETAYRMGWSEAQLMDHMTRSINYRKLTREKTLGGTAAETKMKLESVGRAYGLNLSNKYLARQIERITEGRDTYEGAVSRVKDWAKREYAAFAPELDGGATVADIAEPYVQKMADLLELNPESVNIRSNLIQKALKSQSKDGKPAALSLTDFEQLVRNDRRWQYTDNAREETMNVVSGLLRDFGLTAA